MNNMTADFQAIRTRLQVLPAHIQSRVVVGATRRAAKVIADDAKARVPVRTGLLKKTIGVKRKSKKYTKQNHVSYLVTSKKTKFRVAGRIGSQAVQLRITASAFYSHMVEFGTVNMSPRPFLRPAYEGSAQKAIDAFKEYATRRIDREITILGRT
ncbi:MAG: HK97 gp10 family phage protein [Sulfurovum sp.]